MNISYADVGITPLLYRAAHKCNQLQDEHLKKFEISSRQAVILALIQYIGDGAINQKTLSKMMNVKESSVSSIVKTMIKNEVISKKQSKTDGRNYILTITEKGKQICNKLKNSYEEFEDVFYKNFTDEEKKIFKNLLIKLI